MLGNVVRARKEEGKPSAHRSIKLLAAAAQRAVLLRHHLALELHLGEAERRAQHAGLQAEVDEDVLLHAIKVRPRPRRRRHRIVLRPLALGPPVLDGAEGHQRVRHLDLLAGLRLLGARLERGLTVGVEQPRLLAHLPTRHGVEALCVAVVAVADVHDGLVLLLRRTGRACSSPSRCTSARHVRIGGILRRKEKP